MKRQASIITNTFVIFLFVSTLFVMTGCTTWKLNSKNSWNPFKKSNASKKEIKDLPDAPYFTGGTSNELVEQASYLRNASQNNSAKNTEQDTETPPKKKKWYNTNPFQSKEAASISKNLGVN
ncbi:MAG: hypothetical protein ACRC2T_00500 [Thermoguttaceae bacterium]